MSTLSEAERERREARKFGTDTPHKPTDEFVRRAFTEGARSLWPDSRDPGWHVTFDRWLESIVAARVEAALAPVRELAEEWEATRNGVLSPGLFWAVDDLTERGIVQPLTGMIMGVDHDYAPSGSKDVPLRATPTPEPCRWTNGGAPACSETRDERYWCEPCRERREVGA